ncbi:hypothetical protein DFH09DRAFT_1362326 [Mycena vulgaris]|nr:hypothetical protein DFH09DRAFT_1362326 [Mycena vulgaris]
MASPETHPLASRRTMVKLPSVAPALPLDLERQIFELVALSRPVSIPNLMRLPWRALPLMLLQFRVEPLLYRALVIGATNTITGIPYCSVEIFMTIASTKSASFMHDAVRNLMFVSVAAEECKSILSACTGVENLWIVPMPDGADHRTSAHSTTLPHLQCDFEDLCGLNLAIQWIARRGRGPRPLGDVAALPHLTHLAFYTLRVLAVCAYLLDACTSLRALIVVSHHPTYLPELEILAPNPRFVVTPGEDYSADWQLRVLYGADDYWARGRVHRQAAIWGNRAALLLLRAQSDDPKRDLEELYNANGAFHP